MIVPLPSLWLTSRGVVYKPVSFWFGWTQSQLTTADSRAGDWLIVGECLDFFEWQIAPLQLPVVIFAGAAVPARRVNTLIAASSEKETHHVGMTFDLGVE